MPLHKIILGGEKYLPFALSKLRQLTELAKGMGGFASQTYKTGGATVSLRVTPTDEYLRLEGGSKDFSVGVEADRLTVRWHPTDSGSDWKIHSQLEHAYADTYFGPLASAQISPTKFVAHTRRTTDTPGSTSADPLEHYLDGFGSKRKVYAGPETPYLSGVWGNGGPMDWVVRGDGSGGTYLFTSEVTVQDRDPFFGSLYQEILWKCEHNPFNTQELNAKPAMWNFTYDHTTHSLYGLKTMLTDGFVHVGEGKYVYGLGGSSEISGVRDADHKMVIVVSQDFDTYTAYDVETGIGTVFGANDFELSSLCYIGDGKCMFTAASTLDYIIFNSATGGMTAKVATPAPGGWSSSFANIMAVGDDSACYWEYIVGADALPLDLALIISTEVSQASVSWAVKAIDAYESDGTTPLTVDLYFAYVSVRRPLVKDGLDILDDGELATIFHVPGVGHCEFRSTDLGTKWIKRSLISTVAPEPANFGLLYRELHFGDPKLSNSWG